MRAAGRAGGGGERLRPPEVIGVMVGQEKRLESSPRPLGGPAGHKTATLGVARVDQGKRPLPYQDDLHMVHIGAGGRFDPEDPDPFFLYFAVFHVRNWSEAVRR